MKMIKLHGYPPYGPRDDTSTFHLNINRIIWIQDESPYENEFFPKSKTMIATRQAYFHVEESQDEILSLIEAAKK